MKFLSFYRPDRNGPPTEQHLAEMGQLIEEMTKAGTLITTGALHTGSLRVRRSGGEISVTDGPLTETKEVILGYALLEARSKEHVIELTKRFLGVAGDGESEIRQVFDGAPDCKG